MLGCCSSVGPPLKLDANIEIGRRDRAYAGNQSELLLVVCRWNVHILQPTKLFQDAFDSLEWVNKLSQLIEGGAQLSHVRVLPLLAKLEPTQEKDLLSRQGQERPHSSTSGCNILPRTDTRHACPDRSDYVRGRSAEKHAYTTRIHVCRSNSHLAILCHEELAPSRNISKYLEEPIDQSLIRRH
jgi:hypothetical protein